MPCSAIRSQALLSVDDAAAHTLPSAENSDAAVGIDLLAGEDNPVEVPADSALADSAYGTCEMLETAQQDGILDHQAVAAVARGAGRVHPR